MTNVGGVNEKASIGQSKETGNAAKDFIEQLLKEQNDQKSRDAMKPKKSDTSTDKSQAETLSEATRNSDAVKAFFQEVMDKQFQKGAEKMSKATEKMTQEAVESQIQTLLHGQENTQDSVLLSLANKLKADQKEHQKDVDEKQADAKEEAQESKSEKKSAFVGTQDQRTQKQQQQEKVAHDVRQLQYKMGKDPTLKEMVSQYAATFSSSKLNSKKDQGIDLDKHRDELFEKGITHSETHGLEVNMLKTMRSQLKEQLKQCITERYLSMLDQSETGKMKRMQSMQQTDRLMGMLMTDRKLGHKDTLQKLRNMSDEAAYNEVGDHVGLELENMMLNYHKEASGSGQKSLDLNTQFQTLKRMALVFGADFEEIEERTKVKAYDLGYMLLEQGEGDQKEKESDTPKEFEFSEEDEKNVLLDRMRALLMQRAVKGDFRTQLETIFSIRKTKSGLMRLGVYNKDLEKQLEEESRVLATETLKAMLNEALLERASYHTLRGTTFQVNERKIKTVLKNLKKLDCLIDTEKFNQLRDSANRKIHGITLIEIQKIEMRIKEYPELRILKKRQQELTKVIARLQEETPSLQLMTLGHVEDELKIEEDL